MSLFSIVDLELFCSPRLTPDCLNSEYIFTIELGEEGKGKGRGENMQNQYRAIHSQNMTSLVHCVAGRACIDCGTFHMVLPPDCSSLTGNWSTSCKPIPIWLQDHWWRYPLSFVHTGDSPTLQHVHKLISHCIHQIILLITKPYRISLFLMLYNVLFPLYLTPSHFHHSSFQTKMNLWEYRELVAKYFCTHLMLVW